MNTNYFDILEKIKESPKWWDENAVPRFIDFHPSHKANIYAKEVKLLLIECQHCQMQFKVCMSHYRLDPRNRFDDDNYGDPPNVDCCAGGPSSSSTTLKVLEYWRMDRNDWVLVSKKDADNGTD